MGREEEFDVCTAHAFSMSPAVSPPLPVTSEIDSRPSLWYHSLPMAMDALEKEHLRRKMALRMQSFLEGAATVSCVSGHFYEDLHACELCGLTHTQDILVIKNRSGKKKMLVASSCLREMVRFQVCDVEELPRWLGKLKELEAELEVRKAEMARVREEERKRLEKKVIVRKSPRV